CTNSDGVISWSDGSTYVQPTPWATAASGFYRAGETSPCVGLATDSSGSTLSKCDAAIHYASSAGVATITCPDLSTFTASPAQVTAFNRCRGIACPPTP